MDRRNNPPKTIMMVVAPVVVIGALLGLQTLTGRAKTPGPQITAPASLPGRQADDLQAAQPDLLEAVAVEKTGLPASPDQPFEQIVPDQVEPEPPNGAWEPVAPGVHYRHFTLPDPNQVHVARMDRRKSDLFIESAVAQGRLSGGLETVSAMSERYEESLNFWGRDWGSRNDVLVAINGSFFDGAGVPDRGQVQSGWYAKWFSDYENGSGFAWGLDGRAFVGGCVAHFPGEQQVTLLKTEDNFRIAGLNRPRQEDELVLYTHHYGRSTHTDDTGAEILVELVQPAMIAPSPSQSAGIVRQIGRRQGDTPIPFDHIVLSATGRKRAALLDDIDVGDWIGISQELTHFESDCRTPHPENWAQTYASIGGSFHFLVDGESGSFTNAGATSRHPRTAVAFNDRYLYFIVVDGRQEGVSRGMNMAELAAFSREVLEAREGIALDGGGSSTMVIDGRIVNTPSDRRTISCGSSGAQCEVHTERAVANGLMIVMDRPASFSTRFGAGVSVITSERVNLRLGPGTNFAKLMTLEGGAQGQVVDHAGGLNGVYATGRFWWKIRINGQEGWVAENWLLD